MPMGHLAGKLFSMALYLVATDGAVFTGIEEMHAARACAVIVRIGLGRLLPVSPGVRDARDDAGTVRPVTAP